MQIIRKLQKFVNIAKLQDLVFGKLTLLRITGTGIKVRQGRKRLQYELPKNFQSYNYLNHPEEMAGWLQAILQEDPLRIRRCKIVLDAGQVFLQTLRLPEMTEQERASWLRWEGMQYIPFAPDGCRAVLIPWKEKDMFLLAAIPVERITALEQMAGFLKARLEQVTVAVPGKPCLPLSFLPAVSRKEKAVRLGYQGAIALCLLTSIGLLVHNGMQWRRLYTGWQKTQQELDPLLSVKREYAESRETAHRLNTYQQMLEQAEHRNRSLYPLLRLLAEQIPEGCWLEELQLAKNSSSQQLHNTTIQNAKKNTAQSKNEYPVQLELRGCAETFAAVQKFTEKLKASKRFTGVSVAESGEKKLAAKDGTATGQTAVTFLVRANIAADAAAKEESGKPEQNGIAVKTAEAAGEERP